MAKESGESMKMSFLHKKAMQKPYELYRLTTNFAHSKLIIICGTQTFSQFSEGDRYLMMKPFCFSILSALRI